MVAHRDTELFEFSTQHFDDDSYRITPGIKLYLLVGGRGTRLASITKENRNLWLMFIIDLSLITS